MYIKYTVQFPLIYLYVHNILDNLHLHFILYEYLLHSHVQTLTFSIIYLTIFYQVSHKILPLFKHGHGFI
jgi:hypothetical protein